jgi:phospholipid/cholesterol/gamma-HCH transport system permease protein
MGLLLAFVTALALQRVRAGMFAPNFVALVQVRELGPILTAIIVAARIGTRYAADPEPSARALPRVLALAVTMPLLCIYANFFGIASGTLVSTVSLELDPVLVNRRLQDAISLTTLAIGLGKCVVFGVLVALCGTWAGMHHGSTPREAAKAASQALVSSITLILIADVGFAVGLRALGV